MTCRDAILEVIRDLVEHRVDKVVTLQEVVVTMRARKSPYAAASIRAHMGSRMCVNAPRVRFKGYADLERVSAGRYRLLAEHQRRS